MKKNKRKKKQIENAQEHQLFHSGLFGHKVERDRTKFNRKKKHKHQED